MPRIRVPKDWRSRAARAFSNLKAPDIEAVCFWCGHPYRTGECSREGESAHLLQCPEFPQDAKRRMLRAQSTTTRSQRRTPKVGIIYLVGRKLWIDETPLNKAGHFGNFAIHERDHISYWAELVKGGDVLNSEYEEYPRGRVAYDSKAGKFTLLADRCILGKKRLVTKILSRMNLPVGRTKVDTDNHYRCHRCLGQSR